MLTCLLVSSSRTIGGFEFFLNLPNGALSSLAGNIDRTVCDVKILDLVAVRFTARQYFAEYLQKNNVDVIGFSAMVFQFDEILELAKIVKSQNKNIITILGGYYATVCVEELLASENIRYFDFVISGEGEAAFNRLMQELNGSRNFAAIPGLSYARNGTTIHNPCGELIDLNTIQLPNRDARIFQHGFKIMGYPADVVETSRGCTYTCNFCSITQMYGRSFRRYNISRVINDIRDAKKHGAKAIFFTDDNITLNTHHFEELANAIIANNLNDLKYFIQASVKGFNDNRALAALIKKAGFEWVFLGIESNSDEALTFYKKDNQLKSNHTGNAINLLKEQNIFVFGGLVLGSPFDTKESIQHTYEFVKHLDIDYAIFSALTPFPGTKLREELLEKNLITNTNNYSAYDMYRTNIRTLTLNSFELFEAIDSLTQKYFVDSGAFLKILKRYPQFLIHTAFNFVFHHPDMVFHHLTQGRFLNKSREQKYKKAILHEM